MHEGQLVAYHSKMLNNAQRNYSTVDKELLSLVMTLCEFWSMLSQEILQTIGKLPCQKTYCSQQLSGFTK